MLRLVKKLRLTSQKFKEIGGTLNPPSPNPGGGPLLLGKKRNNEKFCQMEISLSLD